MSSILGDGYESTADRDIHMHWIRKAMEQVSDSFRTIPPTGLIRVLEYTHHPIENALRSIPPLSARFDETKHTNSPYSDTKSVAKTQCR